MQQRNRRGWEFNLDHALGRHKNGALALSATLTTNINFEYCRIAVISKSFIKDHSIYCFFVYLTILTCKSTSVNSCYAGRWLPNGSEMEPEN